MPAILTKQGKRLYDEALSEGANIKLTHIGLGNGSVSKDTSTIPNEVYKSQINRFTRQDDVIIVGISIANDTPSFSADCVGVYAGDVLFAVANISPIVKPRFSQGAEVKQISIQIAINLNNASENVSVNIINGAGLYVPYDEVSTTSQANKILRRDSAGYASGKLKASELYLDLNDLNPETGERVLMRKNYGKVFTMPIDKFFEQGGVPAGTIITHAGSIAPSGYLLCDGSEISKEAYAGLYAVIGSIYGAASMGKFKLPDLRGEFIRGLDNARGIDKNRSLGSFQYGTYMPGDNGANSFVIITNTAKAQAKQSVKAAGLDDIPLAQIGELVNANAAAYAGFSGRYLSRENYLEPHGGITRPRNIALNFFIKY